MALDGVDEFLATICATPIAWPYEAADVDFHTTEGRSWRVSLSADGARPYELSADDTTPAAAVMRGTASELVLVLYQRIPLESMQFEGELRHHQLLRDWDPGA